MTKKYRRCADPAWAFFRRRREIRASDAQNATSDLKDQYGAHEESDSRKAVACRVKESWN